jgi:regulator of protease activity HflC (stomatin/prohibitin superfamily)
VSDDSLFVLVVWGGFLAFVVMKTLGALKIVPQKTAMIVERFGRYHGTLNSGFHILIPWVDRVAAVLDLKEMTIDVPPQECFTKDEVKVHVDGVIYLSVLDPVKAAYGVTQYQWAAMQLAQTTTRSVIGKISLDKTFEERERISAAVVDVLTQVQMDWGILVHRYEVKNLQPPESVRVAMEKQVKAERQRRALLARSEGDSQSRINRSEGLRTELVNTSMGEMQRRINEAQGKAQEIIALADASAQSIEEMASALSEENGREATHLQLTEKYLTELGHIGDKAHQVILPMDLSQIKQILEISRVI